MKKIISLILLLIIVGCKSVPSINEIKVNDKTLKLPCNLESITELTHDSSFLQEESKWEHEQGMNYQYTISDYNVFVEYTDSATPKDAMVFQIMQWDYHKSYEDYQSFTFPGGIYVGMNITENELKELISKEYGDISKLEILNHSVILKWGQPFSQKHTDLLHYPLEVQLSEDNVIQMVSIAVNLH